MFMKNFLNANKCLTSVNINQNFFYLTNRKVAGKMKDVYKGKPIHKSVWLKSKMHCILSDDGKESNTTKKVNIAIELMNTKTIYLIKK